MLGWKLELARPMPCSAAIPPMPSAGCPDEEASGWPHSGTTFRVRVTV
jgi:hypothetical protein